MDNKKKFMVFDSNGHHEYDLLIEETEEGDKTSLFYSSENHWSETIKGDLALSMIDNGSGVSFSSKLKKLDYSELTHVRLLINFEQAMDVNPNNREKYRIVEDKTIIEL